MRRLQAADFSDVITLMSCHDIRLEKIPDIPASTLYRYMKKLREMAELGSVKIVHLSYYKPLGISNVLVEVNDASLADKVVKMKAIAENDVRLLIDGLSRIGIPMAHLVSRIYVLAGNRIVIVWFKPVETDFSPVKAWAEERRGRIEEGWLVPVHTCLPSSFSKGSDEISLLGGHLQELLATDVIRLKNPIIAYMLLSVLERYPLARLQDVRSVSLICSARGLSVDGAGEATLRYRLVRKYYELLSRHFVVGRFRVFESWKLGLLKSYIVIDKSCAESLYGILALKGISSHVFYGEALLHADMLIDLEVQRMLLKYLKNCVLELTTIAESLSLAFPYELYDPVSGRWRLEPGYDIARMLCKLRLANGC